MNKTEILRHIEGIATLLAQYGTKHNLSPEDVSQMLGILQIAIDMAWTEILKDPDKFRDFAKKLNTERDTMFGEIDDEQRGNAGNN